MRIFAVSDIHSFFTLMKNALNGAGFEPGNPNHLLVVCGDLLDRGNESQQVLDYMLSVSNKVLIKGNHSTLFEELCERSYPLNYDWSNGTANSVLSLAPEAQRWDEACRIAMEKMKPLLDQMVDYFETEHYVFCHGYIPYNKCKNWRNSTPSQWENARWVNGMEMAMDGYTIDKCVICGHYHTSWGHALQDKTFDEWGEEADFSPFYYKDKLIAIDACTAYTGKVNVLVLEDEFI